MVFQVRRMKDQGIVETTDNYQTALSLHTLTPDSWIETIDADIEDLDEGPYYPDALFQNDSKSKFLTPR